MNMQFDEHFPTWSQSMISQEELEDESELLNLGFAHIYNTINLVLDKTKNTSVWTDYPTRYKFHSIDFYVSDLKKLIQRETYSLLDLFGDIGGLVEFF
jgi:hypothetical protein